MSAEAEPSNDTGTQEEGIAFARARISRREAIAFLSGGGVVALFVYLFGLAPPNRESQPTSERRTTKTLTSTVHTTTQPPPPPTSPASKFSVIATGVVDTTAFKSTHSRSL